DERECQRGGDRDRAVRRGYGGALEWELPGGGGRRVEPDRTDAVSDGSDRGTGRFDRARLVRDRPGADLVKHLRLQRRLLRPLERDPLVLRQLRDVPGRGEPE